MLLWYTVVSYLQYANYDTVLQQEQLLPGCAAMTMTQTEGTGKGGGELPPEKID